jgi:hypothetical protein
LNRRLAITEEVDTEEVDGAQLTSPASAMFFTRAPMEVTRMFSRAAQRVRMLSKATAAQPESVFPWVPVIAIALSAPVVGFKTGMLDLQHLPPEIRSALPPWVVTYLLSAAPPMVREAAPEVAQAAAPPISLPVPTTLAESDVRAYLESNKDRIVGLLYRDLSQIRAQESWLKVFTQPRTSLAFARERRAVLEQLALRGARE